MIWLIHIAAALFCLPALLITIPMHLMLLTLAGAAAKPPSVQPPVIFPPPNYVAPPALPTYKRNAAGHLVKIGGSNE